MEEYKHYFLVNGIKCRWNFKLLPEAFMAITLFGNIFFRGNKEYVKKHLLSHSGKRTINHEHIHMLQAESFKTKYFGFYIYYIWYWLIGLFKYGVKDNISYHNIPFEREAYKNEHDFNYNETHWKDYR